MGQLQNWADYFLPLAEGGNVDAQIAVGWEYFRGEVLPQDERLAEAWFRRAQLSIGELAIYNIIKMYHIANNPKIDEVFQEKEAWSLGAIDLIYAQSLIKRGLKQEGILRLRSAKEKGNLYAAIKYHQETHRGIKRILGFPFEMLTVWKYAVLRAKRPSDPMVLA